MVVYPPDPGTYARQPQGCDMTTPRHELSTWDPRATDLKATFHVCPHCEGSSRIKVSLFMYMQWTAGANIQDVWPHVPADQRETMITGYHSACFDELFKEEDDE